MMNLLYEFLLENIDFILENKLKECFILHIITLFDCQKIDSIQMKEILIYFNNLEIVYEFNTK